MKIRVAIIEQDENYVRRLVNNWQINYADKLEIYSFSTFEIFQEFVRNNYVSVILASETIKIDVSKLPERASFAYLVSNKGVEEIDGQPAVCKFQTVDLLYKNVLSLFADKEKNLVLNSGMGSNHVVLFT
ncbi:MAG: hypothetical protein IJF07_00260, partial [Lachnospiraceae bacterium]|nr:hypothetical protein [Lachnospiraceae bacterium]